jgi:hypothetical protein
MPQAVNFPMPFASACNPDRTAARLRNLHWARKFNLVASEADERRYDAWDITHLTCLWLPRARGPDLDLGIDAIFVGTVLEEAFDDAPDLSPEGVRDACAPLLEILRPEGPPAPSGVLSTALADVWERTCSGSTLEWRQRAARHWRWFIEAFSEEARRRRSPLPQTLEEYLELRRKSGFVHVMTDLTEKANGFEVSERTFWLPGVQRLLVLTADLIDTMNDVCSAEQEAARGDVHNLVLILQSLHGISREDAMARTHDHMRRWCDEFLQIEARLAEHGIQQHLNDLEADTLRHLVLGLKEGIGGHPDWYRDTARYNDRTPQVGQSLPASTP